MKKLLIITLAAVLLIHSQFCSFAASPAKELRRTIESISYINMETAQLDNAAIAAYEFLRIKLNLPPIETSATMRFKGYDVSKLEKFADSVEKSPTSANIEAAGSLITAINAVKEIHNASFLLSEEIFATGYQASLSAFSFTLKLNRVNQGMPLSPAIKKKICEAALNTVKEFINFMSTYLPPDISRFVPVCLWITNEICARSLDMQLSSPQSGICTFTVLTIGRISMAFTHDLGFFPKTQKFIDELGDAALNSKIGALSGEKK